MKWNWGTGIVVVSLLFMSFIVTLVVKTYKHKVDLVSEDYYSQELVFQERINKMNNASALVSKVSWETGDKNIVVQFPKQADSSVTGTIEFFRPSDSGKDLSIPVQLDREGKQAIDRTLLVQGLYKIKIDWVMDHKGYYIEEDIFIQ